MSIRPLSLYRPQPVKQPRFAASGRTFFKVMDFVTKNRTYEMLFLDAMGFGVLRAGMDLFRPYMFRRQNTSQPPQPNYTAARERGISEIFSILTDNIAPGAIGFGVGYLADKSLKSMSNQFIPLETMDFFKTLAQKSPTQTAFISNLAKSISVKQSKAIEPLLRQGLVSTKTGVRDQIASNIAKLLKKPSLDMTINKQPFKLNALLKDTQLLFKSVGSKANFGKTAQRLLNKTLFINRIRIPISFALGLGMTLSVPLLNRFITKKTDGITGYPGEIGLRKVQHVNKEQSKKPLLQKLSPYLYKATTEGNPIPLLVSCLLVPFALGILSVGPLTRGMGLKAAAKHLSKGWKGWTSLFQFEKGFPFTTQQQMASLFAGLIFARLAASRTGIEFRERTVDGLGGWALWILATPLIKRWVAKAMDKRYRTQLLKKVGNRLELRSSLEIKKFIQNPIIRNRTLQKFKWMNAISIVATLALMGIIEPFIAIKWSEQQVNKQQALQSKKSSQLKEQLLLALQNLRQTQQVAKPTPFNSTTYIRPWTQNSFSQRQPNWNYQQAL